MTATVKLFLILVLAALVGAPACAEDKEHGDDHDHDHDKPAATTQAKADHDDHGHAEEHAHVDEVKLTPGAKNMGFIVVGKDGVKDVDADRSLDPSKNAEVWLKQGDPTVYPSQPGS